MKTFTTAVNNLITQKGIEPLNILEVQWVADGPFLLYGDKEVPTVDGVILELSNLEAVIKLDSQGQSQTINVKLDDTSGAIKDIINVNDVHGSTVKLFQWFETLPLTERFQLYEGEISSPIVWSEGDRTISFSIITKLADKEVGFSPEEGYFPFIPDNLVGVPWPMAFGLVQNVPAIRLQDVPTTQTAEDFGVADPTLEPRIDKNNNDIRDLLDRLAILQAALITAVNSLQDAIFAGDQQQIDFYQGIVDSLEAEIANVVNTILDIRAENDTLNPILDEQQSFEKETLQLISTQGFPSEPLTFKIGNVEISGSVSGNSIAVDAAVLDAFIGNYDVPFGFTFIPAGTTITISADQPIYYICNIIESEVHTIQVYRQVENGLVLVTLPSNYYTVRLETSGPYTFTLIEFPKAPSNIDQTLGDDIYVTLTSTVGPNTVDIMLWLIETYTDLDYDEDTFNEVKLKLENYPSHFAKLDRPDIFTMLEEVAFQSRCAIWIQNNTFYIKYLSEEQDSVDTITETNIDAGSMILNTTQTEELVTKLTATWTDDYALDKNHQIVLRHNIVKYGKREREINFYIYNIGELVLKSATFWLIRFANIWKILSFDCYVEKLALDTFDTITLDFDQNFVANSDVKAFINDLVYNSEEGLINITCWLPVRFGEMDQYTFSWPSQILTNLFYPTDDDILLEYAGGGGPGTQVEGDFALTEQQKLTIKAISLGVVIQSGARDQRRDYGEYTPSDLDDVKPEPLFPGTPFETSEAPAFDYSYGNYGATAPPVTPSLFQGATFPASVIAYNGSVTLAGEERSTYTCNVYTSSLSNPPTEKIVIQLQIISDERIPPGTWVMVSKLSQPVDENDQAEPGLNNDGFEWSMQTPIWL